MIEPQEEGVAGHRRGHAGISGGENQDVVAGRRGPADVARDADVEHQAAWTEPARVDAIAGRRRCHHDRGLGDGFGEIHLQPRAQPGGHVGRPGRSLPCRQDQAPAPRGQQGGHGRRDAARDPHDRNLLVGQVDPQVLAIMLEISHGRIDRQAVARRHGDRLAFGQERAVVADDPGHRAEPDDAGPPADGVFDGLLHELERPAGVAQNSPRIHRDLVEPPFGPGAGRRDQPVERVGDPRCQRPSVRDRPVTGPECGMCLGAELEQVGPAPGLPQPAITVQRHQIRGLLGERVDQEGESHPRPVRLRAFPWMI